MRQGPVVFRWVTLCCMVGGWLGLLWVSSGCQLIEATVRLPGRAVNAVVPRGDPRPELDLVATQQIVLRLANELFSGTALGVDVLRKDGQPVDRAQALTWKISLGTTICTIASGPNAVGNLLDLTVFVTVLRTSVEDYWQPTNFGESAQFIVDVLRRSESEIWERASRVLSQDQQRELKEAIDGWCRDQTRLQEAMTARAAGWAMEVGRMQAGTAARTGSVFGLLMLDPFSGLDPTTREITQSRLLAERALFVVQRMPELVRWQTELLALDAVQGPAMQQLVANTTAWSDAIERITRVAEQLPGQVTAEREAILRELEKQEAALTPLIEEVRRTLVASTAMSTSWNVTLTTFDALMQRFGLGEDRAPDPGATPSEPFRIGDYGRTAEQLDSAAARLTELLLTFERTLGSTNLMQLSAQMAPVVGRVQDSGKEMVDYAFGKAVQLVVIMAVAALLYRLVAARILRSRAEVEG